MREALAAAGSCDVLVTTAPGDERRLARQAAASGAGTIIALGGDGTWGNVARGIVESGRDARLALIPAGTGNDFGHGLGLPMHDLNALVRVAVGTTEVRVDLGCVDGAHFLNVAGIGIETEVVVATARIPLLRGPLLYIAAALPRLASFRALPARIAIDEAPAGSTVPMLAIIASNSPRFGGGFRVAPGASVTDGLLDLVTVRDATLLRRLALFGRVRMGRHLGAPEVRRQLVRTTTVVLDRPPLLDVDGELIQASGTEVSIACVPSRLRIAVPER